MAGMGEMRGVGEGVEEMWEDGAERREKGAFRKRRRRRLGVVGEGIAVAVGEGECGAKDVK